MESLYKSCLAKTASRSDRYVTSWLYDRLEYPKCAGIGDCLVDGILEPSKGLRW